MSLSNSFSEATLLPGLCGSMETREEAGLECPMDCGGARGGNPGGVLGPLGPQWAPGGLGYCCPAWKAASCLLGPQVCCASGPSCGSGGGCIVIEEVLPTILGSYLIWRAAIPPSTLATRSSTLPLISWMAALSFSSTYPCSWLFSCSTASSPCCCPATAAAAYFSTSSVMVARLL